MWAQLIAWGSEPPQIEVMTDTAWGMPPDPEPIRPFVPEPIEPEPEPEPEPLPAAARRRGRPPSRERQVVCRTLAVADLDELDRGLLAAACGCPSDDTVVLTLSSLDRGKSAAGALSLVLDVAGADPVAAGALAVGGAANRDGFRRSWAVLARVADLPAPPPTPVLDAALTFAGAAQALDSGDLARLNSLRGLLQ